MATHTTQIRTVKQRKALRPANAPYWHAVGTGRHIGYRKTDNGGTWSARFYDAAERKRRFRSFGDLADYPDSERFDEAVKLAREFFTQASHGGRKTPPTVAQAWDAYAAQQRRDNTETAARDAEARKARHVTGDPIAHVRVDKITNRQLTNWRERITGNKTASTVNRDIAPMGRALRLALDDDDYAISEPALRKALKALKPTPKADGRRELYLTRDQRRALIDAIPDPDLKTFVTVLASLPLRPGALANVTVGDFDAINGTVTVRHDKGHETRTVPVPDAIAATFRRESRNKLPAAPLLSRWDGKAWDRYYWRNKVKDAVHAADLPEETCCYTLRHSTITDLTQAGLDLFTVAKLAGTSIKMIEAHYGHLQAEAARDALAGLAL